MPQNFIPTNVGINPSNVRVALETTDEGVLAIAEDTADQPAALLVDSITGALLTSPSAGASTHLNITSVSGANAGQSLKATPGVLNRLLVNASSSTITGSVYDVAAPVGNVSAATIATYTAAQLLAIIPAAVGSVQVIEIPFVNGVVVAPAAGQAVAAVFK